MKAGSFYQNYREVTLLVVHCSATRCDRHFSVEALRRSHLARGFADIGYHFYITRDDENGVPADTRTYAQKCSLLDLLRQLKTDYPNARISGHRQLSSSIHKACPCFDAKSEYETIKN